MVNPALEGPDRTEAIELVSRLVAGASVNPMGSGAVEPPFGEARVAGMVEDYVGALGIPCQRQEVLPGRFNVVASLEPPGFRKTVIWEAHMDTCKVEGMTIPPFEPRVEDGKIFGRGACDDKGSLAAMLLALKMLSGSLESLATRVILVGAADEEFLFAGVKKFVELGGSADLAIVGEPTGLNLVVTHKGLVRWRIITHGKAAHGCQPELGRNAIYGMSRVIRAIEERVIPLYSKTVHPLLGSATINVGTIHGGQQINIVPDECVIEVERRLLPGEKAEEAMNEVRDAISDSAEGAAVEVEFEAPFLVDPALDGSPEDPHARFVAAAARRILPELKVLGAQYGSDATKLAGAGIPTVVFGPGDIAQAHAAVEFVAIEEVIEAARVYSQIALEM